MGENAIADAPEQGNPLPLRIANPGRGSTYLRENSVQTTWTTLELEFIKS
jgi:hypothetical protein